MPTPGTQVALADIDVSGGTFSWSPGGQNTASIEVTPSESTIYEVSYTTPLNCFSVAEQIIVDVTESFTLTGLTANPNPAFEGTEITLNATIDPDGVPLNDGTYDWSVLGASNFASTNVSSTTVTLPEVTDEGSIIYEVNITDNAGCSQSDTTLVLIMDSIAKMPNAFTPNGDDINSVFGLVKSDNVIVNDFRIYDRWGNKVYELSDDPNGWDGNVNDQPAPADVYLYIIEYEFAGQQLTEKGDVTLIR